MVNGRIESKVTGKVQAETLVSPVNLPFEIACYPLFFQKNNYVLDSELNCGDKKVNKAFRRLDK